MPMGVGSRPQGMGSQRDAGHEVMAIAGGIHEVTRAVGELPWGAEPWGSPGGAVTGVPQGVAS